MIDAKETKRIHERVFEQKKDDPQAWAFTAMTLKRAAQILFEANETSTYEDTDGAPMNQENAEMDEPATLLYAYAMENAVKGFLIKKHGGFEQAKKALGRAWMHHELSGLATATALPLNQDQVLIIQALERFIRWAGKYPTSLDRSEFTLPKQFNSAQNAAPNTLNSESLGIIEPFYEQLQDVLLAELRAWSIS